MDELHGYASTQIDLPPTAAEKVQAIAKLIDPEDLHEKGVEHQSHVTLKYGLKTNDPQDVKQILSGEGSVNLRLGKTKVFQQPDKDVLVVEVDSPDLERLNQKVTEALPNDTTFPYHPHSTVAYCKPGAGDKYSGIDLNAHHVQSDQVTFSDQDNQITKIPLARILSGKPGGHGGHGQ